LTLPVKYANTYLPIKYFLNSYRALSDGRTAVSLLNEKVQDSSSLLSVWKINWIAACAILRTSIDLFKVDKRSCINADIRREIGFEWEEIANDKDSHEIFWHFLRKERDNIVHHYEWSAYEVWMDDAGNHRPARVSLLDIRPESSRSVLIMRSGFFEGRDSLELLQESTEWVQERIFNAIRRAGFDPEEDRNLLTFKQRPATPPSTLLGLHSDE
jgi:hypothetical protein